MPFRMRMLQQNAERRLEGSVRHALARAREIYASVTAPQQEARAIRRWGDPLLYNSQAGGRNGKRVFYHCLRSVKGTPGKLPYEHTRVGRFIGNLSLDEIPVQLAALCKCRRTTVSAGAAERRVREGSQ